MTTIAFHQAPSEQAPTDTESPSPYLTLPPQGMSRASQLLPFLPFGTTTLWAWSKDGRFPSPVKLSPTMTAWRNADVIEWLRSHNEPAPTNTVASPTNGAI
jgi:predicted DNA-binding transcriptional regulator AlpA